MFQAVCYKVTDYIMSGPGREANTVCSKQLAGQIIHNLRPKGEQRVDVEDSTRNVEWDSGPAVSVGQDAWRAEPHGKGVLLGSGHTVPKRAH